MAMQRRCLSSLPYYKYGTTLSYLGTTTAVRPERATAYGPEILRHARFVILTRRQDGRVMFSFLRLGPGKNFTA